MPQELPGFYYDAEKNRYFSLKGRKPPIPNPTPTPTPKPDPSPSLSSPNAITIPRLPSLLRSREISGDLLTLPGGCRKFHAQILKSRASLPRVWVYNAERTADAAIERVSADVITPHGRVGSQGLLLGSSNGLLTLCDVGGVGGSCSDYGWMCNPRFAWPAEKDVEGDDVGLLSGFNSGSRSPPHLHRPTGPSTCLSSDITSVKTVGSSDSPSSRVLITTLGSERCGATVNVLDLAEPFNFWPSSDSLRSRMHVVHTLDCTLWAADCSADAKRAVIATASGAGLVDLETGAVSWISRSSSDVLVVKFDRSGNLALCGHRNGSILVIDVRQTPAYMRQTFHRFPFPSANPVLVNNSRPRMQWLKVKGTIRPDWTARMSKSIASLVSLRTYEQNFLASSMDGSISLYDLRHASKGPLQTYEGNVNSHTRIQLGTDPSESFVLSGGEDHYLRLWDIRSGKLLFQEKFSEEVISVMCSEDANASRVGVRGDAWGSWLGSRKGLLYMQF